MKTNTNESQNKEVSGTPKDIKTRTQLTTDELQVNDEQIPAGGVSDTEVEEANILINPDVDSMESRG